MDEEMEIDRRLKVSEVAEVSGLAVSTIWRLAREGKFPKGDKLTENSTRWKTSEVKEWLDSKSEEAA